MLTWWRTYSQVTCPGGLCGAYRVSFGLLRSGPIRFLCCSWPLLSQWFIRASLAGVVACARAAGSRYVCFLALNLTWLGLPNRSLPLYTTQHSPRSAWTRHPDSALQLNLSSATRSGQYAETVGSLAATVPASPMISTWSSAMKTKPWPKRRVKSLAQWLQVAPQVKQTPTPHLLCTY